MQEGQSPILPTINKERKKEMVLERNGISLVTCTMTMETTSGALTFPELSHLMRTDTWQKAPNRLE